ncbi:hypothetical protein WICMUC_003325 [Wickerhamomyces mucosus]|uniref:ABC transporter domain-containing protein n=1 Tax=Wickerhamomyces mucosus TaxID=1378264 RepID=A0A9P8PN26_9ASCO|nr:hypothetical protein WICMUC_003325 [Wickerhamomyces mucosus]
MKRINADPPTETLQSLNYKPKGFESEENQSHNILKENQFSFVNIDPVDVQVRNLSVSASIDKYKKFNIFRAKRKIQDDIEANKQQPILKEISFDLPSGSLMAIIGGSGSGKTTLLNVLANRTSSSSSLVQKGEILYNGNTLSNIRNAYVIQQDILSPILTTRETLIFATELRLPDSTTKAERLRLVEEVILELGLKDCADTLVGDSTHKGLSGGEKRRLSIGIQILSNPSLLFLDEPTTGLDAHSAYLLIKTLKSLAMKGRTIIISIHQPRSDIFLLFDYLCILSNGETVYNFKVSEVLQYFKALGYITPEGINPADFLIDITAVDTRVITSESQGLKRLRSFVDSWKNYQKSIIRDDVHRVTKITSFTKPVAKAPFVREVNVLVRRTLLLTFRDSKTLVSLILEAVIMGVICGWVFYKPGYSLSAIRTYQGALYSANGLQGYLMLLFETYRLSSEDIKIFDRERADKCISIPGFLISRRIAKLFTEDFVVTILFSLCTYFMFGLQNTANKFFVYYLNILLVHLASMTCAMFCVSVSRNFSQNSLIANLNYTLQTFACGYFLNAKTLPVYVRWTKYIAYIWYGFGLLISNQFTGFQGDCPYHNEYQCQAYNGKYIIQNLGFWENWLALPACVILCWVIGMYLVAALMLKLKTVDVSLSKQVKSSTRTEAYDSSTIEENHRLLSELPDSNDFDVDINLSEINLSVQLQKRFRSSKEKIILKEVNATFKSGKINAIMGPSGSGKTSLLNLVSGRLSSDLRNKYNSSGEIYFNDFKIPTRMTNAISSYVSQTDDHLIPTLSVFETLLMAADLRLNKLNKQQRLQIVQDIISKLGLKNCRNTLIGSEFIKGISGGEKRRVAIGIQLLNNPKVLFLDEPTSGLDGFTSSYILEILQNLSDEGKTIILTIHQPRSDLFKKFGQILLLAKGGKVAYNGEQRLMNEYFTTLGYPCPVLSNLADHILDLISVNNQNAENEIKSKKRVEGLLTHWKNIDHHFEKIRFKSVSKSEFNSIFSHFIRRKSNFQTAFFSCYKQLVFSVIRNPEILVARFTNVLGIAIILAVFSAPLKPTYIGVSDRLGLIQQYSTLYFCGMLNNLTSYPMQRDYFYHEYDDGIYGILPFFLSYICIEVPFEVISCMIFSCLAGLACGLPRTFEFFISLSYVGFMVCFCGESLGIITNTLFSNAGFAINAVSIVLSIGTFMGGLMSLNMNKVLKAINYISPLKYALSIMINMGFPASLQLTCDDTSKTASGDCIFNNGEDVLVEYGLKVDNYKVYFAALFAIAVGYRLLAYAILKVRLLKFNLGSFIRKDEI